MGMPCFSKPLQRSSVTVCPQQLTQNGHQSTTPSQSQQMVELVETQFLPPPAVGPNGSQHQQACPTNFLQPRPTQRLIVVSPSISELPTTTNTSRVSTPLSPRQSIVKKVSDFLSRSQPDDYQESTKKKPDLARNASKVSLIRRRSKTSLGRRSTTGGRPRTPSMVSDTSSMLCLSDGLAGLYALASLTAYETKLVPIIWQACLDQNEYYCVHVLSRLFNRHPELEEMFTKPAPVDLCKGPLTSDSQQPRCTMNQRGRNGKREIMQDKSDQLMVFLNRLIMTHELDYDRLSEECERLGRSHAVYYYERGLQPYHWDAFAISVVQEYKKTNMNVDMITDEKELQQLAWTHFTTAVVSAIKESFEDELQRMTPGQSVIQGCENSSIAGDRTAYRF